MGIDLVALKIPKISTKHTIGKNKVKTRVILKIQLKNPTLDTIKES